jgi:hypothetical protein
MSEFQPDDNVIIVFYDPRWSVIGVAAEQSRSPNICRARQGLGANKEQDAHRQVGSGAEEHTAQV